jgi:SAM-dependent methyltransferase
MAGVAAAKGITAEIATFEDWQPGSRTFDLVVFAQSFHWVQPRPALAKVRRILNAGGRLVLLSNRVVPKSPTWVAMDDIYSDYLGEARSSIVDATRLAEVTALLEDGGFRVNTCNVVEQLRYTTEDWLNLVFTYSNHLTLSASARDELRGRLTERIGQDGVEAINDALAVVCTPA